MIQNFRFLLLNMVTGGLVCTVSICKVVLSMLLLVFKPFVLCQKNWDLWNNLCILRHAFLIPWLMMGDFNETLN